jgi:hypothetical protein
LYGFWPFVGELMMKLLRHLLLLTALLAPSSAWAQIGSATVVGSQIDTTNTDTSIVIDVSNNVSAGNLIVVGCVNYNDGSIHVTSVTDNATGGSNTYSASSWGQQESPNGAAELEIWFAPNARALTGAITVNYSGAFGGQTICGAAQASGIATTSPQDTSSANGNSSTSSTSVNLSLGAFAQSSELVIGLTGAINIGSTTSFTYTESSGFTNLFNLGQSVPFGLNSSFLRFGMGFKVTSGTSAVNYNPTIGSPFSEWGAQGTGFEGPAGGAVKHNLPLLGVGQ